MTGSKDRACQFWEKNDYPKFGESWKRWEACPEWQRDWFNFPHVVTWLNDGRYKQDPAEAKVKIATPRKAEPWAVKQERERAERIAREEEDRLFGGVG